MTLQHIPPANVAKVESLADWIRARRHIDRGQLLEELIAIFDFSGDQLQRAINARTRPVLVLPGQPDMRPFNRPML
jgi:hypothetical protein